MTDSLAAQLAPVGVRVSVIEPGNFRSEIGKKMLARLSQDERKKVLNALGGSYPESGEPEPDEVAKAVEHALVATTPKRRYLVTPNPGQAERTIRKQIE